MIKVGICVSYDWQLLKNSLPLIYKLSDLICLSLDKNRRAWTGKSYQFDNESFFQFVKDIDVDRKLIIYEDDFSLPNNTAMENDTRQRNLMAEKLGKGGWHIQIDSDEYVLDFQSFVRILKRINTNPSGNEKPLNVCISYIPLIKKLSTGYLCVDFKSKLPEMGPIATNVPSYERARNNGHFNIITSQYAVHDTWARSDDELYFKINNWGHSSDELKEKEVRDSYYKLWKSLDEFNYKYISNFHPAVSDVWPALKFVPCNDIKELLINFNKPYFPLRSSQLLLRNNRNVARLKAVLSNFF
ncbi:hypothetical protein [Chryseosolibacter indicus]|uniref:Glycosyl transferase family 2 n=1 Tax=Chryseosolibacter indicus TaxID=2782351 RepID=A0ABS5VMH1_9BACT|nr:hypothetical protein [Chryseosolibacter indicus]MBT1702035.1 hypothetical protein [Chryseosolibacter indicus]